MLWSIHIGHQYLGHAFLGHQSQCANINEFMGQRMWHLNKSSHMQKPYTDEDYSCGLHSVQNQIWIEE